MTEKFPNFMNTRNPHIQESPTSSNDKKHKENYTKEHHNQIAHTILKEILKAA